MSTIEKTLVLCMGNSIMGDDSAGIRVGKLLKEHYQIEQTYGVKLEITEDYGTRLLPIIEGYNRVIVVDTVLSEESNLGKVEKVNLQFKRPHLKTFKGSHFLGLPDVIALGNTLGLKMPREIIIIGIHITGPFALSENVSQKVEVGIKKATQMVLGELQKNA